MVTHQGLASMDTPTRADSSLNQLLEVVPDALVVTDSRGRIAMTNNLADQMFGYAAGELTGQPVEILLPARLRERHQHHRAQYYQHAQPRQMDQVTSLTGRRKNDSEFPVDISLSALTIADSRYVLAAVRDVTARRHMEETLQKHAKDLARSNADLAQFAYVASHDLQEPLRIVSSYAQLLERRYKGRLDADANEFIDFMVNACRRMQNMINDLLAYARVDSSGKELEEVDLNRALAHASDNLRALMNERGVELQTSKLPTIVAEESQMVQLFQNLLANAIKFNESTPPRIRVSCAEDRTEQVCTVADNGIGIDPRFQERIFKPFQRLHASDEYAGTGIGLALCRRIVERHGGRIWLESEPGRGTRISFALPLGRSPSR